MEEKLEICQKINDESSDELVEELELNNLSLREKIYEMEVRNIFSPRRKNCLNH